MTSLMGRPQRNPDMPGKNEDKRLGSKPVDVDRPAMKGMFAGLGRGRT